MNRTTVGAVALLSLLLASPLAAQPARELRGQVFHLGKNGEKVFEPGLIVTFVETGATDDTNDQGIFRLPLRPIFQPGDSVTISVDKPGWRIRFPLDGEARIPRDFAREIVPVELLQVGSKLFWTNDRIEKFIRDASERSKQEGRRDKDTPSLDLGRDIKEWAAKYGFNAQEAREAIDRWIAEVEATHEDSYQRGLAAFAKQQFDTAAERFRTSAEWRIRQLAETRKQQETLSEKAERLQEEVVRDLRLQGDSHFYAYRHDQALAVYEQAHQYTSKDQTPQLWGATLNDIGSAHRELGIRVAAAESPGHLAAAIQAHRQALLVFTREQIPQEWARTQYNLGRALGRQGERAAGDESVQLLAQAVEAFRQALLVFTREQIPQEWAAIQNSLSTVLKIQGARTTGQEGAQLLEQAVQACRQALLVRTREQLPQEWARSQSNLGNALQEQGARTTGQEGVQLFEQAVQAYRQALLVYTREHLPQNWAWTQTNLGVALEEQGARTAGQEGAQLLEQAIQTYRQLLLVYTREHLPQDWARTQTILGNTLLIQGVRMAGDEGAQLLAQAVHAHQQALLVYTREHLPQSWALAHCNLGAALTAQGERASGAARAQLLAQAVNASRQALLVFTPDHFPDLWSKTRSNEAEALFALHRYEEAAEALSQALAKELDANIRVAALGYAIAAGLAIDSVDVAARFKELLGVVATQPKDFSNSLWSFEGTLHSLGEDPDVPHKELFIRLFQALAAPDRDSMLQGLRDVKEAILPGDRPTG